ncbi:MAG TPA: hypothetical protein P5281_04425 [Anaerovoracaceae bacterium]|nr:hypothetical protein [Eubacteriales bacterium]HPF18179.1 hypothetical protein [Bacillota bacterium]HRV33558.1 hypothetical protein [Anaerovoracaceae bacterium]
MKRTRENQEIETITCKEMREKDAYAIQTVGIPSFLCCLWISLPA